jgi:hypothetical protein
MSINSKHLLDAMSWVVCQSLHRRALEFRTCFHKTVSRAATGMFESWLQFYEAALVNVNAKA